MANPRPYLRSAQKIEWDSTFGKNLARRERKSTFFETRQICQTGSGVRVGGASPTSRPYFDSATLWPNLRGRFGNFLGIFPILIGTFIDFFFKLYIPLKPFYFHSLINSHPNTFPKENALYKAFF